MNRSTTLTIFAAAIFAHSLLIANPAGGIATHGDVIISPNGSTLSIEQLSDKAVINWESFSISASETTRFIQPRKTSAALNRVVTGNPSAIHGSLQSNGKVILINPNGILVGPGGRVDAGGGFVASTLDVPDSEFLSRGDLTFSGNSLAAVSNLGTIIAAEGDVILLSAGDVTNAGTIEAPNGVASLATGTRILVKSSGDERILVEAGSANGKVDHSGTIRAAQAELKALGGNTESLAVNMSGVIEATGVQKTGGRILLTAGGGGVSVSGEMKARAANGDGGEIRVQGGAVTVSPEAELDASGQNGGTVVIDSETETKVSGRVLAAGDNGAGGRVEITGETVILDDAAFVDASSVSGAAGEVFVGGGFQGNDPDLKNADSTTIGSDVILQANAAGDFDAGTVIVWADDITIFGGHVAVNAGSGDAGFVEISGKRELRYRGSVDLSSETGNVGTLLLDPDTIIIVAGAAGAGPDSGELADGAIEAGDGGAGSTFTITNGDIAAAGGNVLLQANQNITANAGVDVNAPGDIAFAGGAGGVVNLNNVNANDGSVIVVGGSVNFNNIDTSGDTPGEAGGNVTIIAGNGNITGNMIDADGAAGGPGQDGGDAGGLVLFDAAGNNLINIPGGIDNRGGDGGNGDANSPGGNGGDGGLVSVGNGTTPSSVNIPMIRYGGGNAGNGNPPGFGGQGGNLFVNNDTLTPNNEGPDGVDGTSIAPPVSPVLRELAQNLTGEQLIALAFGGQFEIGGGPGFNSILNQEEVDEDPAAMSFVDVNTFVGMEYNQEAFGTTSTTDWNSFNSDGVIGGADHPYGGTDFGYGGIGQFPDREAAIFDSMSGITFGMPEDRICPPSDYFMRLFLADFLGIDPFYLDDFIDEFLGNGGEANGLNAVGGDPEAWLDNLDDDNFGEANNPEDAEMLFGEREPVRTQGGEVPVNVQDPGFGPSFPVGGGFFARQNARFAPNRDDELDGGGNFEPEPEPEAEADRGDAGNANGNQNGGGNRRRGRVEQAADARDEAKGELADAEKDQKDADKDVKDAEADAAEKKQDLADVKKNRADKKADLDKKKKKLDEVNRLINELLAGGDEFGDTPEGRRGFRAALNDLDKQARALRAEVKAVEKELAAADKKLGNANADLAAANQAVIDRKNEAKAADQNVVAAGKNLGEKQGDLNAVVAERDAATEKRRQEGAALGRRRLAAEKKQKADELAAILEEERKDEVAKNKALNDRRKVRDSAFRDAKELDVSIDPNQIGENTNVAQLVQQQLIEQGEAATLEDATLDKQVENPFDSPDARAFEDPLITELFDRKEKFEANERFLYANDELEFSIRDFVDEADVDYFQETRRNDRGDGLLVTQTFVDKTTGEFITSEMKIAIIDVEDRLFRFATDVANEIGDVFGPSRGDEGQPVSRVIRGNINSPGASTNP